jgi:8-hydroxy-5-deazaflavin:NADPH oxidoreductase
MIRIIGTGNVGKALGGSLVRAGHEVTFAARDVDKTRRVAQELGATAAESPAAAAAWSELILLAVPYGALEDTAGAIAGEARGKVVIDVTNPLKADDSGLANEGGPSAAEQVAELIDGAQVAKAFNTVFAGLQAEPATHDTTLDVLYATDDERARQALAELISSIGFRPVDAGPLSAARQMEAMAWLNIQLQARHGGDWRSTFVLVGAPEGAVREPAVATTRA